MPTIKFDFKGQTFKADVSDSFLQRNQEEQQRILKGQLVEEYETRIPDRGSEEKGFLDYLALLERPAQAIKVGLKESDLGGNIFRDFGGVDLTPEEGLLTGMKRGWMGEDEVRTQDFLPEKMDPFLKGVLGFAGDVATDPLTWTAPAIVRGTGGLISKYTPEPVKEGVKKAGKKVADVKFGEQEYGLPDLARLFNVPMGAGRAVKGTLDESRNLRASFDRELSETVPQFDQFYKIRSKETGETVDNIKDAFATEAQRNRNFLKDKKGEAILRPRKDAYGNTILDDAGNPRMLPVYHDVAPPPGEFYIPSKAEGNLLPLASVSDEGRAALGSEGMKLLDSWEDIGSRMASISAAYGQPFESVLHKGYFPGVLTPKAREYVSAGADEFIESVDDMGEPVYRGGYKRGRGLLDKNSVQEANELKAAGMAAHFRSHGVRPNPLDKPYEYFHTDPATAMTMRWTRQNNALQTKWMIDELTDAPRVTGIGSVRDDFWDWSSKGVYDEKLGITPTEDGWVRRTFKPFTDDADNYHSTYSQWKNFMESQPMKPELEVGRWVKPDGEGGFLAKRANPASLDDPLNRDLERYIWEPLGKDSGFVEVKGINRRFLPNDVLDDEWVSVYNEQLRIRGFGRFTKVRLSDKDMRKLPAEYKRAKKIADDARTVLKNETNEVFMAPKQVSRQIEDVISLTRGDVASEKEVAKFLQFYDQIQNGWKAWTLGVRPAYHTRNAVGNIMNAYLVTGLGANIPEAIEIFTGAAKLQYYARFVGSQIKRDEFMRSVGGVRGLFEKAPPKINPEEWTAPNFLDTGYSMEELVLNAKNRGVTAGHYKSDNIRQMEGTLAAQAGTGSTLSRTLGPENPFVQAGFGLGGTIEGNARYAVFLHSLRQIKKNPGNYKWTAPDGTKIPLGATGTASKYFKTVEDVDQHGKLITTREPVTGEQMKFDAASMETKGSQFDYLDVSKFERDYLKRAMPFYTWTRKNIPVQLKHLVLNPQRAEKLHLAKEQFEHESGDLDWSDYGAFWGERVPVFLGKESGGVIKAFTLLNIVPMADLQRILKPKALIAEMVSPLIKAPLEQLTNYDSFRKKPIKAFPGETKDYFGVSLPPRLWHLAQIIVPLTEINRLNPAGVFGERLRDPTTGMISSTEAYGGVGAMRETAIDAPEIARWIRFFSGGTTYDVDLHKHRYIASRNLKKDAAELIGKMKWAFANSQNERAGAILEVLEALKRQEITDPFDRR